MKTHLWTVTLALALGIGCAAADGSAPVADADGGQFGEEDGAFCTEVRRTAVALGDTAPNGVRAQDILDHAGGSHAATLVWHGGATTGLTVGLSGARDAAWIELASVENGEDLAYDCPPHVGLTFDVTLTTDDGALAEAFASEVTSAEVGPVTWSHELEAPTGTLDAAAYGPRDYDRVRAWIDVRFDGGAISGAIEGQGEWTAPVTDTASDSEVGADGFPIGAF